jgi:hypothetical protein
MDWFDRISIGAVVVLVTGTFVLTHGHKGEGKADRNQQQRTQAAATAVPSGELDNGVRLARNLIEAGNLVQAEGLVRDLQKKFPYQGELALLMGDVFMRKQDPVKAMHEYKAAIDLNPDYLDKKTPLFQGKKLKVAVGEALVEIDGRLKREPGDEALKQEKKVIYYLYRKIAGSCG